MKGIKSFEEKINKKHQQAHEGYRNLSKEEKDKKHQCCRERHKNFSEEDSRL